MKIEGYAVIRDGKLDRSDTSISEQGEYNVVEVFSICTSEEEARRLQERIIGIAGGVDQHCPCYNRLA